MSEYIPVSEEGIRSGPETFLRRHLREAQAEIERLNEYDPGRTKPRREAGWIPRIDAPEKQVAELSDPYPKDGPNVRNQNAHDALNRWLKGMDERLRKVEEVARDTDNRDHPVNLGIRLGSVDARLAALSETVAKNRKDHDTLTDRSEGEMWIERRVEQRRCNQGDRRHTSIQQRLAGRRGDDDRRQP